MNRTEYIGKLNALYVGEKNCLEELITAYDEKDQEIERLKNGCKELEQQIDDLYKLETTLTNENERLNNIINELEKYLNEQVDYMTHHSIERMVAFDCCRHKLQELKGNNNGVWVNNLLEVIKENNIEFGSDKE